MQHQSNCSDWNRCFTTAYAHNNVVIPCLQCISSKLAKATAALKHSDFIFLSLLIMNIKGLIRADDPCGEFLCRSILCCCSHGAWRSFMSCYCYWSVHESFQSTDLFTSRHRNVNRQCNTFRSESWSMACYLNIVYNTHSIKNVQIIYVLRSLDIFPHRQGPNKLLKSAARIISSKLKTKNVQKTYL